jgi:hypothetical protein
MTRTTTRQSWLRWLLLSLFLWFTASDSVDSNLDQYQEHPLQLQRQHQQQQQQQQHPSTHHPHSTTVIYTYYEPPDNNDNEDLPHWSSMKHTETMELLHFWQTSWQKAGWTAVVLNRTHADHHAHAVEFETALDALHLVDHSQQHKARFRQWWAMAAVGGGILCDMDVFPLRSSWDMDNVPSTVMTVYQAVAPALTFGIAQHYETLARALLADAAQQRRLESSDDTSFYWTDALSLVNVWRSQPNIIHIERRVVSVDSLLQMHLNFSCTARPVRHRWVVQWNVAALQRATAFGMPVAWTHPARRVDVARRWMLYWQAVCANRTYDKLEELEVWWKEELDSEY